MLSNLFFFFNVLVWLFSDINWPAYLALSLHVQIYGYLFHFPGGCQLKMAPLNKLIAHESASCFMSVSGLVYPTDHDNSSRLSYLCGAPEK